VEGVQGVQDSPRHISIFASLGAGFWLRAAREQAARRKLRSQGLEIYFANITSWSAKAASYLEHEVSADCLAVVETHLRGKSFVQAKNRMCRWGFRVSGREALASTKSSAGTSGGCMVGIAKGLASYTLGPADYLAHFVTPAAERYWSGRSIRLAGRDFLVLAVYLPPGEEHTQARQDTMQDLAGILRHMRGCWIMIGDFNQHPEELAATGFLTFVQGTAVATKEATCRQGEGSVIDYAVVQAALAPAVSVERDLGSPWGPHYGLRVKLDIPKLDDPIHTWSVTRPFQDMEGEFSTAQEYRWEAGKQLWEAKFEQATGRVRHPVTAPVDEEACSNYLTAAYADFSARAEMHLLSTTGMLDTAKRQHVGRGRPRAHRVTAVAARTPEPERYYERTANSLARTRHQVLQLAKARGAKHHFAEPEVAALLERVRRSIPTLRSYFLKNLSTRADDPSLTTLGNGGSREALTHPPGGRSESVLQILEDLEAGRAVTRLRLVVLGARIEKATEAELRGASRHRRTDFRQWIRDHLAKGAKALHRFTNQENKPLCLMDELHMANAVLCTSEELMRERVKTWTSLWGVREEPRCTPTVASQRAKLLRGNADIDWGDVFPDDAIRKCISTAPSKAALGADQWRPRDWKTLPDEGIAELRCLLVGIERSISWPRQALLNVAVFLGKPTVPPSERSITLTAGIYRLWCKLRRPQVLEWETGAAGFWDKAVAGSSALQAALQRELRHEVASELGACTGGVYWDMAKFYDTLRPDIVMERAIAMGFPLRTLVLGMMVHQAARALRAGEAYSEPILPAQSILAGCGLSVSWTRAVLFSMLEVAHRRYPVEHYFVDSWVDDLSSVIQGTTQMCKDIAVETGVQLAGAAKQLGLVISEKSKVIFNRPGVAKQVALRLQEEGVPVTAAMLTKDLGIGTGACSSRRHTGVMKTRRCSMTTRLNRIRILVKQDRKCRHLVWTGAKPQGTWGHQGVGLAPTSINRIRQQFAAAAMIRRGGGCTTTAFALTVGQDSDPMISLRVELLKSWLEVAATTTVQPSALQKVWRQQQQKLSGPLRWGQVKGPMGAVIATLTDLGWIPEGPTRWTDPFGSIWQIDPRRAGVIPLVLEKIRQSCIRRVWGKASEHYCGQGIGEEADLQVLQRLRRECTKEGTWREVALIDMIGQGACWPPARKALHGISCTSECQFCRRGVEGTLLHQAWQCPVVLEGIGSAREEARHLEGAALGPVLSEAASRERWSQGLPPPCCEAFWCRGILPKAGTGPLQELLQVMDTEPTARGHAAPEGHMELTEGMGPIVTVGSDGSGGEHGADPTLRRVGWSWAALSPDGTLLGSVHGGLGNDFPQTVPRAELHAAVHFLQHVSLADNVQVELHIDNSYVVGVLQKLADGWRPAAHTTHGDLMADLCDCEAAIGYLHSGRVRVYKIKSHLSQEEANKRGYTSLAWKANRIADELAEVGARSSAFSSGDVQLIRQLEQACRLVVRRLLAVSKFVVEARQPEMKAARAGRVPLRRRVQDLGTRGGHCLRFSAGVSCRKCRQHSRMKRAITGWVAEACPGPGARYGHQVRCIRGLFFCAVCGSWSIPAGGSSRAMHRPCTRYATKRGSELLGRLQCDPPKLPDLHGRRAWPDGTPADPPAALAAAGRQRRGAGVPSTCSYCPRSILPNPKIQAVLARVRERERGLLSESNTG
jgi:hypothetical protein